MHWKNSVLDVIILSNSYKQSAYCLNEAGIIWFKKDCDNILIGLPEIMPNNMNSGFINNDCVLRRLDNLSDIRIIYKIISNALKINQADEILFNRESRNLQSKYKEILNNGEYYTSNSYLNDTLFSEITTENEQIVLFYLLQNEKRKVSKDEIKNWLETNEITEINIDDAFDLLSTLGSSGIIKNDLLIIDDKIFRKYSHQKAKILTLIQPVIEKHKDIAMKTFIKSWKSLPDWIRMFVAYIFDSGEYSFFSIDMPRTLQEKIKAWEFNNFLTGSRLSDEFMDCIDYFVQRNWMYITDCSVYDDNIKYTIYDSLKDYISFPFPDFMEEILELKSSIRFET